MHNHVNHTWQYIIVHSDTSDQHQHSEIVSATTITAHTTQQTTKTHTDPGLTKLVSTIQHFLPSTKPETHKKLTHR